MYHMHDWCLEQTHEPHLTFMALIGDPNYPLTSNGPKAGRSPKTNGIDICFPSPVWSSCSHVSNDNLLFPSRGAVSVAFFRGASQNRSEEPSPNVTPLHESNRGFQRSTLKGENTSFERPSISQRDCNSHNPGPQKFHCKGPSRGDWQHSHCSPAEYWDLN